MWEREIAYLEQRHAVVVGIDEVGRGAWAGPIVAAAYVFTTVPSPIEVFDSKVLTGPQRFLLMQQLLGLGSVGIGEASATEIDDIGIQQAQYLAYVRAMAQLPQTPEVVLLDGRQWYSCPYRHEAIINGDALVASIAAASIFAKVYRDGLMQSLFAKRYPEYHFHTHVGYGTKDHQKALQEHGPCEIHRKSYKPVGIFVNR